MPLHIDYDDMFVLSNEPVINQSLSLEALGLLYTLHSDRNNISNFRLENCNKHNTKEQIEKALNELIDNKYIIKGCKGKKDTYTVFYHQHKKDKEYER